MKAHFVVQSISIIHRKIERKKKKEIKKKEGEIEKTEKEMRKKRKIAEILFIFYALLSF